MTRTHPGLVHPTHISETMSNQYPTTPPPGPVNRQPASPVIEHLPRGYSTRANLLAFVVIGFFGTLYNGCLSHHLSSKKLLLDLYPRTQIIADARIV